MHSTGIYVTSAATLHDISRKRNVKPFALTFPYIPAEIPHEASLLCIRCSFRHTFVSGRHENRFVLKLEVHRILVVEYTAYIAIALLFEKAVVVYTARELS